MRLFVFLCNRRYKAAENLTLDIFSVRDEQIIQSCSQKVERGEVSEELTEGIINFQWTSMLDQ